MIQAKPHEGDPPTKSEAKRASTRPERYIAIRKGGSIRVTKEGLLHIVEPLGADGCCGGEPGEDVQWYLVGGTLPHVPGNPLPNTPPSGPGYAAYAPYAYPAVWPANQPNPNRPSIAGHANITRHWNINPVPWRFNLPDTISVVPGADGLDPIAPNVPGGAATIAALLSQDVFVVNPPLTPPNPPVQYLYAEALWDAAITFARFSSYTTNPDLPSSPNWGSATWTTGYPVVWPYSYPPGHPGGLTNITPTPPPTQAYDPTPTGENNPMGIPWSNLSAQFAGYMYHLPYSLTPVAGGTLISGLVIHTSAPTVPIVPPPAWNGGAGNTVAAPTGGPTGDGQNEYCWCTGTLPTNGLGLVSMLVDPNTGIIQECDIIMPTTFPNSGTWGAGNPINTIPGVFRWYAGGNPNHGTPSGWSIIPHEIGHFFGLDHTNLYPLQFNGNPTPTINISAAPATPPYPTAMLHANWADVPLMATTPFRTRNFGTPAAGGFWATHYDSTVQPSLSQGKTGLRSVGPLHPDDLVGMCRLYPQQSVAPNAGRQPMINDLARIEGRILAQGADDSTVGVFGRNVLPFDVSTTPLDLAPNNAAVSGTHRLTTQSIVGSADISNPGAPQPTSGDFIIPYIAAGPHSPTAPFAGGKEYALCVEPLAAAGISVTGGGASFGEWWFDTVLRTQLTNPLSPFVGPNSPTVVASYKLLTASRGSLFCVPGTVIQLNILETSTTTPETVSRPVVALHPRTGYAGINQTITMTVSSDFPILQAALIIDGKVNVIPGPGYTGGAYSGPYTWTYSANAYDLGIGAGLKVTATAVEVIWQSAWGVPGPLPTAHIPGVNVCHF